MLHDAVPRRLSSQETFLRAAELALRVTSASGAAVAINRRGEMLCRAATGKLAPPVGARLAAEVGISSQFVGGGRYLCCDDTEKDFRVDRKACRNLGIRSVVVVPVQLSGKVVAILEIFGEKPGAFTEDQVERLQSVADMVAGALLDQDPLRPAIGAPVSGPAPLGPTLVKGANPALDVPPPQQEESPGLPADLVESPPEGEPWRPALPSLAAETHEESTWLSSGFKLVGFSFVFTVGLVAVVFGSTRIYQHTSLRNLISWRSSARRANSPSSASDASAPVVPSEEAGGTRSFSGRAAKPSPEKLLRSRRTAVAHVVSEPQRPNPGEQLKAEPNPEPGGRPSASTTIAGASVHVGASQPQLSALAQVDPIRSAQLPASPQRGNPEAVTAVGARQPLPSGLTGGRLIHRVEPEYPAAARLRRLEGAVTLRAIVAEDGTLQKVGLISGNPALAEAAAEAVGHWRYEPYSSNGQPVRVPIQITVEFKLPGSSTARAVTP
jgi:TonB family protein